MIHFMVSQIFHPLLTARLPFEQTTFLVLRVLELEATKEQFNRL